MRSCVTLLLRAHRSLHAAAAILLRRGHALLDDAVVRRKEGSARRCGVSSQGFKEFVLVCEFRVLLLALQSRACDRVLRFRFQHNLQPRGRAERDR